MHTPSCVPRISLSATAGLLDATEHVFDGGSVKFIPSADGHVRIQGLGPRREWVGEWSCRLEDFNAGMLDGMERYVKQKTTPKIALLG
jgi:hypothetical protein